MQCAHFARTLWVVPVALPRQLALELADLLETLGENGSFRDCSQYRTAGFTGMTTVTKATHLSERIYLRETAAPKLGVVVREQGELPHPRRIEQQTTSRKREQFPPSGGVSAACICRTDLTHPLHGSLHQAVDQAGFSDTRRSNQHRGSAWVDVALQLVQARTLFGTGQEHRHAAKFGSQAFRVLRREWGEIGLVQQHQGSRRSVANCPQVAFYPTRIEAVPMGVRICVLRRQCANDYREIDVCRNRLGLRGASRHPALKQTASLERVHDTREIAVVVLEQDEVTHAHANRRVTQAPSNDCASGLLTIGDGVLTSRLGHHSRQSYVG